MSLFEKTKDAMMSRDGAAMIACYHDDFEFVRHQTGTSMNKAEMAKLIDGFMAGDWQTSEPRCLYENDELMVSHAIMHFPDGTKEAVLSVHILKDGLIFRTETGATLVD
ncbi:MAG: nuclear transport factor 2 family protein [Candidatus Puniceispirillaceae bacterium]